MFAMRVCSEHEFPSTCRPEQEAWRSSLLAYSFADGERLLASRSITYIDDPANTFKLIISPSLQKLN
jgi:hypothetical protein